MKIRLDLDNDGIGVFLGSLETAIMRAIWDATSNAVTAQQMQNELRLYGIDLARSTVQVTLNRLTAKRLLNRTGVRQPDSRTGQSAYLYTPVYETEQAYINQQVLRIARKMKQLYQPA